MVTDAVVEADVLSQNKEKTDAVVNAETFSENEDKADAPKLIPIAIIHSPSGRHDICPSIQSATLETISEEAFETFCTTLEQHTDALEIELCATGLIPVNRSERLATVFSNLSDCHTLRFDESVLHLTDSDKLYAFGQALRKLANLCYLKLSDLKLWEPMHFGIACILLKILTHITMLDLDGNALKKLPVLNIVNLGTLLSAENNLVHLSLANNGIPYFTPERSEALRTLLENCSSLESLSLENNRLGFMEEDVKRDNLIAAFGTMHNLRLLNLSNNDFGTGIHDAGPLPELLAKTPNLEALDYQGNGLGANQVETFRDIAEAIGQCPQIIELNLSNNRLSEASISSLTHLGNSTAHCKELRSLYLNNNALNRFDVRTTRVFASFVENFRKLKCLNLSGNKFAYIFQYEYKRDIWSKLLQECQQLEHIDFSNNHLNELAGNYFTSFLDMLRNCNHLKTLCLAGNELSKAQLQLIADAKLNAKVTDLELPPAKFASPEHELVRIATLKSNAAEFIEHSICTNTHKAWLETQLCLAVKKYFQLFSHFLDPLAFQTLYKSLVNLSGQDITAHSEHAEPYSDEQLATREQFVDLLLTEIPVIDKIWIQQNFQEWQTPEDILPDAREYLNYQLTDIGNPIFHKVLSEVYNEVRSGQAIEPSPITTEAASTPIPRLTATEQIKQLNNTPNLILTAKMLSSEDDEETIDLEGLDFSTWTPDNFNAIAKLLQTCTKLTRLSLSGHHFGSTPELHQGYSALLKACPNLEEVHFRQCHLETLAPKTLSELFQALPPTLKRIALNENRFCLANANSNLLALFEALPQWPLEGLDIKNLELEQAAPHIIHALHNRLAQFPQLKILKLCEPNANPARFADIACSLIPACPNLEKLTLTGIALTRFDVSQSTQLANTLHACQHLKHLLLSHPQVTNEHTLLSVAQLINGIPNLQVISFCEDHFWNPIPPGLVILCPKIEFKDFAQPIKARYSSITNEAKRIILAQQAINHLLIPENEVIANNTESAMHGSLLIKANHHFLNVLKPHFQHKFDAYATESLSAVEHIENDIRRLLLNTLWKDTQNELRVALQKHLEKNCQYLESTLKYLTEHFGALVAGEDDAIVGLRPYLTSNTNTFHLAWRNYDRTAIVDPDWPNLLVAPLNPTSTETLYTVAEALEHRPTTLEASDIIRERVAYAYLAAIDPDYPNAQERIDDFIFYLAEMRRANNSDASWNDSETSTYYESDSDESDANEPAADESLSSSSSMTSADGQDIVTSDETNTETQAFEDPYLSIPFQYADSIFPAAPDSEENNDELDSPSCFPGFLTRAARMSVKHPLVGMPQSEFEVLNTSLCCLILQHFNQQLAILQTTEEKRALFDAIVMLSGFNAEEVLEQSEYKSRGSDSELETHADKPINPNEEPKASDDYTTNHLILRRDFIRSFEATDYISALNENIKQSFDRDLLDLEKLLAILTLTDIGGKAFASSLTASYLSHIRSAQTLILEDVEESPEPTSPTLAFTPIVPTARIDDGDNTQVSVNPENSNETADESIKPNISYL